MTYLDLNEEAIYTLRRLKRGDRIVDDVREVFPDQYASIGFMWEHDNQVIDEYTLATLSENDLIAFNWPSCKITSKGLEYLSNIQARNKNWGRPASIGGKTVAR